jgi:hypothetical protein
MDTIEEIELACRELVAAIGRYRFAEKEKQGTPTPEQVYGKPPDEIEPPEGWMFVVEDGERVFRIPNYGEGFLTFMLTHEYRQPSGAHRPEWIPGPRYILRKARVVKFVECGFRKYRPGDWVEGESGQFWQTDLISQRVVYRRIEE